MNVWLLTDDDGQALGIFATVDKAQQYVTDSHEDLAESVYRGSWGTYPDNVFVHDAEGYHIQRMPVIE